MQIDHIGYVVSDIEKSISDFEKLGYVKTTGCFNDEIRKVKIQFMKNDAYMVELIEPLDETSDAYAYYKKIKTGPYHMCYVTDDIDKDIKNLISDGYMLLKDKEKAIAFDGKNVAFLFKKNVGLIEIVER